jgi:hypothetical protein
MLEYAHFVPGRLRLKISELRHRRRAAEAQAYVAAIPVVKSALANPVTGILTINFDEDEVSICQLWEGLRAQGYVSNRCPEPTAIGSVSLPDSGVDQLGRALLTALVEAVAQHSAQALVRALL